MAIREIRMQDDEILRKKSKEVTVFDERLEELLEDMIDTMHENNGVGLSAVQVGILKRVIVVDIYDGSEPLKVVNPKILKSKGEKECDEGCLSFPNEFAKVMRPEEVLVEGFDSKGKKIKIKAKGLLAQALCHEIDHLEGVLFIDRMEPGTLQYIEPGSDEEEEK